MAEYKKSEKGYYYRIVGTRKSRVSYDEYSKHINARKKLNGGFPTRSEYDAVINEHTPGVVPNRYISNNNVELHITVLSKNQTHSTYKDKSCNVNYHYNPLRSYDDQFWGTTGKYTDMIIEKEVKPLLIAEYERWENNRRVILEARRERRGTAQLELMSSDPSRNPMYYKKRDTMMTPRTYTHTYTHTHTNKRRQSSSAEQLRNSSSRHKSSSVSRYP